MRRSLTNIRLGLLAAALLCGLSVWFAQVRSADGQKSDEKLLLFFDPDGNHGSIIQISSWFKQYFKEKKVPLKFKPVETASAFTNALKKGNVSYALVSSSYLEKRQEYQFTPLIVPSKDGSIYYRKILLDRKKGAVVDLSNKTVAATMGIGNIKEQSQAIWLQINGAGIPVTNARFLRVSKDIDALLALAFGQVHAAIVTSGSIEILKKINPTAIDKFRVVFKTDKILRSPLCKVGKGMKTSMDDELIVIFKEMARDKVGRRIMGAMGFDTWVDYHDGMSAIDKAGKQ